MIKIELSEKETKGIINMRNPIPGKTLLKIISSCYAILALLYFLLQVLNGQLVYLIAIVPVVIFIKYILDFKKKRDMLLKKKYVELLRTNALD